jgi:hypothetical protein
MSEWQLTYMIDIALTPATVEGMAPVGGHGPPSTRVARSKMVAI